MSGKIKNVWKIYEKVWKIKNVLKKNKMFGNSYNCLEIIIECLERL